MGVSYMPDVRAEVPIDEQARLSALRATAILDTEAEVIYDDVARLAALICGTPIALLSLVDENRQWFKARVGLDVTETHRDLAFCAHAILEPDRILEIPDATSDPRFQGNALVTGDPLIRFYAGAPVVLDTGEVLGTVCAIDRVPRKLNDEQSQALKALARQAAQLLQWRRTANSVTSHLHSEIERNREEMAHLTAMAAHGLALLAYVDCSHTYRYVNDQYLHYWNQQRGLIEGRTVPELLGEQTYREQVLPHLEQAFGGKVVSYVARFRFPLLGERSMQVSYLPVRVGNGSVKAVVVRAADIDEIERARVELAQTNEVLLKRNDVQRRFVHMLSHDIREPVNTICNFAGMLRQQSAASMDPTAQRSLNYIERGSQRLRTMLDDLQSYLRLEGDDTGLLNSTQVDLQAVFRNACEDLTDAIQRHGAQLGGDALPCVRGDALLLRLLFQNLLANALKFHSAGKSPCVSWGWRPAEGAVVVWVRDNGIGMDPGKIGRLFVPFSRLVVRSKFEGTGLGLAICKRIVELHGGDIEVVSAPNKGSTFNVWLPDSRPQRPITMHGDPN